MKKTELQIKSSFLLKLLIIGIFLLSSKNFIQAQSLEQINLNKNNTYLDVQLGVYSQASINYERMLYSGEKVSWYGRVGAGASALIMIDGGFGGLGAITMLTGKKNGHFELNVGAIYGDGTEGGFTHPLVNIGYRYQKPQGGLIFRAYAGIAAAGLSLGYSF